MTYKAVRLIGGRNLFLVGHEKDHVAALELSQNLIYSGLNGTLWLMKAIKIGHPEYRKG